MKNIYKFNLSIQNYSGSNKWPLFSVCVCWGMRRAKYDNDAVHKPCQTAEYMHAQFVLINGHIGVCAFVCLSV